MKKIIYIASLIATTIFSACSPNIEVRDMGPEPIVHEIKVTEVGINTFECSVDYENAFMSNWVFADGSMSSGNTTNIYFPFKGSYENKLYLSGGSTKVETFTIDVESTDPAICDIEQLNLLTGGCQAENGKTWVYDTSIIDDSQGYCYMTARYDWEEAWWNPYEIGNPSEGFEDEIKFDIDGAFNFTHYIKVDDGFKEEKGSFLFDYDNMTIKIIGATIPDSEGDGDNNPKAVSSGEYKIQILSDTELLLWQIQFDTGNDDDDYAWAWKFKVKKEE